MIKEKAFGGYPFLVPMYAGGELVTEMDEELNTPSVAAQSKHTYWVPVPVIVKVLAMFVGTREFTVPLVRVNDVPLILQVNGYFVALPDTCCPDRAAVATGLELDP